MRIKYRKCGVYTASLILYVSFSFVYLYTHDFQQKGEYFVPPDWEARILQIREVCLNTPILLDKPVQLNQQVPEELKRHFTAVHRKNLLFNIVRIPSLHVDWCLVPKVASTSLSKVVLKQLPRKGGINPPTLFLQKEVWHRAGHLTGEERKPEEYVRFFITRHPFARIASAFRNKLEDRTASNDGLYFYNTYSSQIIRMTRGNFDENSKEPTFLEFIQFLLNTSVQNDDEHWQPVSLRCRVCEVEFTHVLLYENLSYEWQMFLDSTGLDLDLELPWKNKGAAGSLSKYYESIPREMLERLAQRYQTDFEMFGYKIDDDF